MKTPKERSARSASSTTNKPRSPHQAMNVAQQVFDEVGWPGTWFELPDGYQFELRIKSGLNSAILAHLSIEARRFVIAFVYRIKVPGARRRAVIEYLTRANFGLTAGNFEMDYELGEVRYRNGVDFTGIKLSPRLVQNVVRSSVETMQMYEDGIAEVAKGKLTARAAIGKIEG